MVAADGPGALAQTMDFACREWWAFSGPCAGHFSCHRFINAPPFFDHARQCSPLVSLVGLFPDRPAGYLHCRLQQHQHSTLARIVALSF